MQFGFCVILSFVSKDVQEKGFMDLTAPYPVQTLIVNTATQRRAPVRITNLRVNVSPVKQVRKDYRRQKLLRINDIHIILSLRLFTKHFLHKGINCIALIEVICIKCENICFYVIGVMYLSTDCLIYMSVILLPTKTGRTIRIRLSYKKKICVPDICSFLQ